MGEEGGRGAEMGAWAMCAGCGPESKLSIVVGFVLVLSCRLVRPPGSLEPDELDIVRYVEGRGAGESNEADTVRDKLCDGVGEDGWEGGQGLIDASSSAPPNRDSSSMMDNLGREISLRNDGVREREKCDSDIASSRWKEGTGIEGYGLLASRRSCLSTELAYDME